MNVDDFSLWFSRDNDPTSPSELEIFPPIQDSLWFWSVPVFCCALGISCDNDWGQLWSPPGLAGDHRGQELVPDVEGGFWESISPSPEGFGILSGRGNRSQTKLALGSSLGLSSPPAGLTRSPQEMLQGFISGNSQFEEFLCSLPQAWLCLFDEEFAKEEFQKSPWKSQTCPCSMWGQ